MIFSKDEITNLTADFSIDLTYLHEFSNGDKSFEKEMLISSLDEAEEKMQLLYSYIINNQVDKIKSLAHSLKSMMYVIGLKNLYACFYKIENLRSFALSDEITIQQLNFIRHTWNIAKIKIDELIKQAA